MFETSTPRYVHDHLVLDTDICRQLIFLVAATRNSFFTQLNPPATLTLIVNHNIGPIHRVFPASSVAERAIN